MSEMWHEERLYIDGELIEAEGGRVYENINPATEEVLGWAADACEADVQRAIDAARRAFDTTDWSTNTELRARCLRQLNQAMDDHFDDLAELTIAEVGAPRMFMGGPQLRGPLEYLTYYADMAENYEWSYDLGVRETIAGTAHRWVEKEAIGVVAAITPWNYPHQITLAKCSPALAAGCTVVLKAAPDTPWSALALGRLIHDHTDFPPGVFNIITSGNKAVGEVLTTSPDVDMVSFTGSTTTGRRIMEAASGTIKRVFLELGGKSAHIVLDDVADLASAVASPCFMVCTHGGQGCATSTRLLLPRGRYEEGVQAAAALIGALPYGDPQDPGVMTGAIVNRAQLDRMVDLVDRAVADGARVVVGGQRPEQFDKGFYYQPTLLADVTNDMEIARTEIFGPVLVAIPYEDDDDAVRIANDSDYGLSGAVVSDDREHALAIARRIRTGTMSINGGAWYGVDVPFGGYKQSGVGRESGVSGFEEYLEEKSIAEPA
jgi:aldehyde dehydrogenase (NAD+)